MKKKRERRGERERRVKMQNGKEGKRDQKLESEASNTKLSMEKLMIREGSALHEFDYGKVSELYDLLPERSAVKDVIACGNEVGLELKYSAVRSLMRVFSDCAVFDAELVREGRRLILVKQEYSISEEIRKQLAVEREVIGTPWEVG